MTASWLVQMGWQTAVIDSSASLISEAGKPSPPRPFLPDARARSLAPDELAAHLETSIVIDLSPSPVYERSHIPGAWFLLRSRFRQDIAHLPESGQLVLTSPDGYPALYAADELEQIAGRPVLVLAGGNEAWKLAGQPLERDRHHWASPAIDVYKRPYEGTDNSPKAMREYIEWELQLVAQLANDGVSNFRVIR
jgi:3-mercaptopyruvate sulfurtransferase SseA